MPRRFVTLDVFTDTPLAGNPLAVVLDSEGLDAAAMQAIAREFNLSETVFVLPPEEPGQRARIRIFTPGIEMPFAGHPTVGTAVLLATLDSPGASADVAGASADVAGASDDAAGEVRFGLGENIGTVPCAVRLAPGGGFARFWLPRLPQRHGEAADPALLARALGLATADLGFDDHTPTVYSAGFPYCLIPLRSLDAIGRIRIDTVVWREAFGQDGLGSAYAYTRETARPDSAFHARMFSPGDGIPEDPATGSAVAALAGAIHAFGKLADGERGFRIEQGFEMGRPSLIELTVTVSAGELAAASIGGAAVLVSEGRLNV